MIGINNKINKVIGERNRNEKLEIGALILRLILGITFFVHGYVKFTGGIENTVGWFSSIGLPGSLAYGGSN